MTDCLLLIITVATSCFFTWILRRYAISRSMLDIPNIRSSHSLPTPRGGGVAIVVAFIGSLGCAYFADRIPLALIASVACAGGLIAVVGFLDDHGHVAARWRLLAHGIGAALTLLFLGGLPPMQIGSLMIEPALLRNVLGVFYLVWMLNLYNFMDGIDGLACTEAVSACLGISILYFVSGYGALVVGPMILVAAVIGFFIWNFPPAKIFMGDAGSGFLGFTLATLAVYSAWSDQKFFWAWNILLGLFIVDSTFTLIRRCFRGEKIYEAHRSHAYQSAAREMGSHLHVTVGVAVINIFWLLPIATLVVVFDLSGFFATVLAYLPLVLLVARYRAGLPEAAGH